MTRLKIWSPPCYNSINLIPSEVNVLPTYGYECTKCKEQFEVVQRITENALSVHDDCGGELRRLLYPVGIVFKGPGFHVNDYGKNGKSPGSSSSAETDSKKQETPSETKPEAKSEAPAKAEPAASTSKPD